MIFRRFLAFFIDWIIILIYSLALFLTTTLLFEVENRNYHFGRAWLISFSTLTLPVLMYFTIFESSLSKGTFGKQILKLKVTSPSGLKGILVRNLLKFLPWEIAHVGVHLLALKSQINVEPNFINWAILIFPQVLMVIYFLSIVFSKENTALYDKITGCEVVLKHQKID